MKHLLITLACLITPLIFAADLPPGPYNLSPGQYTLSVPTPAPSPTPSPTPAPTPSADKTTIPPATQIVDSNIDVWTLSGGQCYRDGALAGVSANVVSMAYVTSKVWQQNNQQSWWYWNGTVWIAGPAPMPTPTPTPTPAPTPPTTPSADKTTIPPATQIVDQNLEVWTLFNGQCLRNGVPAGTSSGVILMAYVSTKVWQENNQNLWWYWNGTTWVSGSAPLPTPTPSPTPPVTGGAFKFFGGVFDLPNSSWDHYVHNPYTEHTQPSGDLLYTLVTTDINTFKWGPVDNDMAAAKKNNTPFIWYCGYLNWAAGQGFPANYGYTGAKVVQLFDNLISQAKARYGEADLTKYCIFNYANEALNSYGNTGNTGNWESAFGGKGSTGCDWVINTGKIVRKYLPNAVIGINDFNIEDVNLMHQYGGGPSRLNQILDWLPKLKNAGVIDWLGMEGYNLESQTSDGLSSALNQCGAYVPVIYTEFSPGSYDWFGAGEGTVNDPPQAADGSRNTKVAAWKRLVPLFVNSGHCRGIVGPWVGSPAGGSAIFDGTTNRPAMTWLQSYIPTVIGAK